MKTVQVYRLWEDGTWDLVNIDIEDEPWTQEIVESRACEQAWTHLAMLRETLPYKSKGRCMRVGLYTPVL